ncbi:GNAT family N-acetyltransferase [Bacillus sp. B1-b2]|uniref:GNAT family N-acetyltransferase n=1 Tax=Bacillus sp. B1-b2 TaxID=2653201 RepID=UPI0012625520|nr:GNAT family N-acetyltransferase [Bacillus sp. B1-b2]KAB7672587.1 GNAT family N-acetyltransferase [Bacillus sp. B1-b2]
MIAQKITTEEELQKAFQIRKEIFVVEQGVPLEDEFDEFDTLNGACEHILVFHEGNPVGTGRIRIVEMVGKLERICILEPYRKFGLGSVIIATLEELAGKRGISKVKLHGQTQAQGFYKRLGYQSSSSEFIEDGIPHVLMTKDIK